MADDTEGGPAERTSQPKQQSKCNSQLWKYVFYLDLLDDSVNDQTQQKMFEVKHTTYEGKKLLWYHS